MPPSPVADLAAIDDMTATKTAAIASAMPEVATASIVLPRSSLAWLRRIAALRREQRSCDEARRSSDQAHHLTSLGHQCLRRHFHYFLHFGSL